MSNVALSNHFRDKFYTAASDKSLEEVVDALVAPRAADRLEQIIDLVAFHASEAEKYHAGVAEIEHRRRGLFDSVVSSAAPSIYESTTMNAFHSLLAVNSKQAANGAESTAAIMDQALIPARKYLFHVRAALRVKKEKSLTRFRELRESLEEVSIAKAEYINRSEAMAQFEKDTGDNLDTLLGELDLQETNERMSLLGDPAKDEILVGHVITKKRDFVQNTLRRLVDEVEHTETTANSLFGRKKKLEFTGLSLHDYIVAQLPEVKDVVEYCETLADLGLIKPKNVSSSSSFQVSTVSVYEWTELVFVLLGRAPRWGQTKPLPLKLFGSAGESRLVKLKNMKKSVESLAKKYEDALAAHDKKSVAFEVLMLETLNDLERLFLGVELAIRDFSIQFVELLGQDVQLATRLRQIAHTEDLAQLVEKATTKNKFLVETKVFESYSRSEAPRTVFGVSLDQLEVLCGPHESSLVVAEILRKMSLLTKQKQVINWTRKLESVTDFEVVVTKREQINELAWIANADTFVSGLQSILDDDESLGLLLRRYLLELPDPLIADSSATILNDALGESRELDPEVLRSYFVVSPGDSSLERHSKNTFQLILLHLLKLDALLAEAGDTDGKQATFNEIARVWIHFLVKPAGGVSAGPTDFVKDEYCEVLLQQFMDSKRI